MGALIFPALGSYEPSDVQQAIAHSGGGALAVDASAGSVVVITLTSNITALSFSNFPVSGLSGVVSIKIIQGGAGGFTVGWGTIQWAGGSAPTVTAAAGAVDWYTFVTADGGTTVQGFTSGQNFS